MIANTPSPPYYAVIFTSLRTSGDKGYNSMSEAMITEVKKQPGFLGFESACNETGITVSYWKDRDSIAAWKGHREHSMAIKRGKEDWYAAYKVRICRVERDYGWSEGKE